MDPLLGSSSSLSLPLPLGPQVPLVARTASSSIVVTKGIPPMSFKAVKRIRQWEYVDLANLLISQDDALSMTENDQKTPSRSQGKPPPINDIMTWLTAFSRFMAVVLAVDFTTKEEAAGLPAHQHVILQLHGDLGSNRWLKYNIEFREWTAAKRIRAWGELNLAIYGRCLPQVQPVKTLPRLPDVALQSFNKKETPVCFQWDKGHCVRPLCAYLHACLGCRGPHRKAECPGRIKRARK